MDRANSDVTQTSSTYVPKNVVTTITIVLCNLLIVANNEVL
jgi:hypothetical protein